MMRYGTLLDDPDMPTFEQVVLWRNLKVRIRKRLRVTFYGDRPDQLKDCRTKEFCRDGFRLEIFIMENNLRFSEIVLDHKQLRSLGIGYSKTERLIYLFEEIDNNYRCSG